MIRSASAFWEKTLGAIEGQHWLDRVGEPLQAALDRAFRALGPVGRRLQNLLHGRWLGHALHPALTDIPIGAWTAAVVLDALDGPTRPRGYQRAADHAVALGIIGAAAAAATGLADWRHLQGRPRRLGLAHAALNTGALLLFSSSWLARRRGERVPGRALAQLGYVAVLVSGYLGGRLVFHYRIGVSHADEGDQPRDFVPVLPEGELREDEPRRVVVQGTRIVLVRHRGRIHALGEVCSHLGGPLAEGRIVDDGIECPWHASRFDLETGDVLDSPATTRQPCFAVRVRSGQIEVARIAPELAQAPGLRPSAAATPAAAPTEASATYGV